MKRILISVFLYVGIFFPTLTVSDEKPKNIIFILADDLGWNDTSIYQPHGFFETPNIEKLARSGLAFRNAYSNSPLCSPTRASILTGQTPTRHGSTIPEHHLEEIRLTPSMRPSSPTDRKSIWPRTATRLDTKFATLSTLLQQHGYRTAHFGKWHLGAQPYSPLEHGFEIDIPGYDGSGPTGGFLAPWSFAPNLQPQRNGEHIDIRLAEEAREWILNQSSEQPFYLNFWSFSVHAPFNADPALINYFEQKKSEFHSQRNSIYAAMVKHLDDAVGILWDTVIEAGLDDNTIIIFTSDNGGNMYDVVENTYPTSNFPLRGGKATNYEGGLRVPTVIKWPGLTTPNTMTDEVIQSVDYFPTLLNGLNISWPQDHIIDGNDIRGILSGQNVEFESPVFTYYPTQPGVPDWLPPSITVTLENWKLIRTFYYGIDTLHYEQLYDLSTDIGEQHDLSQQRPDKLKELGLLLDNHIKKQMR